ncbi:protein kinase domain-containing protein [Haliangium sp.]|uniref:protein kinase domain-containing protein n=1 Tax=Haliangium sp. TaxID=2663208 RepID=UPI003D1178E7
MKRGRQPNGEDTAGVGPDETLGPDGDGDGDTDRDQIGALAATASAESVGAFGADEVTHFERGQGFGKYLVLEELGSGGMGIVYAADDPDLDRRVALKVLRRPDGPNALSARTRLLREAQAMARLNHPNVITVYEAGTVAGRDFIAMEYVDGTNLDAWSRDPRTVAEVVAVYREAGRGLAAAHRAGIVHRDFKPGNVLLGSDGRVRVTDFGLARRREPAVSGPDETASGERVRAGASAALTHTGAVLGTPAYMAPEQYSGDEVDERSDQFGFCVALYEALYGERPFAGEDFDSLSENVLAGRLREPPAGRPVPAALRRVVVRGLAVAPDQRYPSMDALIAALGRALGPGRVPFRWVAAGACAAALVAGIVVAQVNRDPAAVCAGAGAQLAGIWDPEIQGRVRTAFAMTGVDHADEEFRRFVRAVDAYAEHWVDMYVGSCEDTHVRGVQNEDVYVLRTGCLQERRERLAALTRAFSQIDRNGVDRAVAAVGELPAVAACADVEALSQGVAPPPSALRAAVAEVREALAEAEALDDAGRADDAIARADDATTRAESVGYLPLRAEAWFARGRIYARTGRIKDARAALDKAEILAEEAEYDEYRARALVTMTQLLAGNSSRFEEARAYGRRARAVIKRFGRDPILEVELDLALAGIMLVKGENDEALALLSRTLDVLSTVPRAEPLRESRIKSNMGQVHLALGHFQQGLTLLRQAEGLATSALGREHPEAVEASEWVAAALRFVGDEDAAHASDLRTGRFWKTERGRAWLTQRRGLKLPAQTRVVRGRVIDDTGAPVVGAEVVVGQFVIADCKYLYTRLFGVALDAGGHDRVVTGADGRFELPKVPRDFAVTVVAEHHAHGRSRPQPIPAQDASAAADGPGPSPAGGDELELRLLPSGSLQGRIRSAGDPPDMLLVSAMPMPAPLPARMNAVTIAQPDGTYSLDHLAPGEYEVFVAQSLLGNSLQAAHVVVEPGQTAKLDVDIAVGPLSITIDLGGPGRALTHSAQVVLVPGAAEFRTVGEINRILLTTGRSFKVEHWRPDDPAVIRAVSPGQYTVCVFPMAGDYRNPEYWRQFDFEELQKMSVYCEPIELDGQGQIEHTLVVPAESVGGASPG